MAVLVPFLCARLRVSVPHVRSVFGEVEGLPFLCALLRVSVPDKNLNDSIGIFRFLCALLRVSVPDTDTSTKIP